MNSGFTFRLFLILTFTFMFGSIVFAAVPATVNYQGYLTDDSGYPVTGSLDMEFSFFATSSSTTALWTETWNSGTSQVVITDGYYSTLLGTYTALGSVFYDYSELWLEITVAGETLSPRKMIASSPYSQEALNADTLDGLDSTEFYKTTDSVDADTLDGQDSTAFAGATHSHSFSEITGTATDAQVPNDITVDYAAEAGQVEWTDIQHMPTGFSDGTDDVGVTTETDPTVHPSIKDGIDFSELSGTATDSQIPDSITINYAQNSDKLDNYHYTSFWRKTENVDADTLDNYNYTDFWRKSESVSASSVPWAGITGMPSGFSDNTDDGITTELDPQVGTISSNGVPRWNSNSLVTGQIFDSGTTVGIGTTPNANYMLDVDGDVNISGSLHAPGMGTPITSLPYYIYSSGYYYLEESIHYTGTSDAIIVYSDNVTIDLNGNTMSGTSSSSNGIKGYNYDNIEVRNGTIRDFGSHGVYFYGGNSNDIRLLSLRLMGNDMRGISIYSKNVVIKNCSISENSNEGIYTSSRALIKDNIINSNGSYGIYAELNAVVINNQVYQNGHTGIRTLSGSTIIGNASYQNSSDGIYASNGTIINNSCYGNTNNGIFADDGSTVKNNQGRSNGANGISADGGSVVVNNSAYDNSTNGIYAGQGTVVIGNSARNNDNDGVHASYYTVIKNNSISSNAYYGIDLVGYSLVESNVAYNNNTSGGAYINIDTCGSCTLINNVN